MPLRQCDTLPRLEVIQHRYHVLAPLRTYGTELINLNSCEQLQLSNAPAPQQQLKRCPE
jgi:hypothetical protein